MTKMIDEWSLAGYKIVWKSLNSYRTFDHFEIYFVRNDCNLTLGFRRKNLYGGLEIKDLGISRLLSFWNDSSYQDGKCSRNKIERFSRESLAKSYPNKWETCFDPLQYFTMSKSNLVCWSRDVCSVRFN